MISGKISFSLLAKTLEIGLYTTLHKLIGLKFVTLQGESVFGIKVILVALILGSKTPV
jgi:hypothetical protein